MAQRYSDHKSTERYDTPGHRIVVGLSTQHIRSHCIWMRRADVVPDCCFNDIGRQLCSHCRPRIEGLRQSDFRRMDGHKVAADIRSSCVWLRTDHIVYLIGSCACLSYDLASAGRTHTSPADMHWDRKMKSDLEFRPLNDEMALKH